MKKKITKHLKKLAEINGWFIKNPNPMWGYLKSRTSKNVLEATSQGVMSQALTNFLSSEEYQKIKEQELSNHKKFVEKFLKKDKSKTAQEEPSHNPQSPETPEE